MSDETRTMGEILGERFADEEALTILTDLGSSDRLPARALVPHGLEYLAKATQSVEVRTQAIEQLKRLQSELSEEVQEQSLIALNTLGVS